MRTLTARALITFAAVALILGAIPLMAQQDSRTGQQAQEPKTAQGQLMRVDADRETFAIQSTQGSLMQFHYTSATKVIGADKGVAGLATMSGSQVSIEYVIDDKDLVATQITVRQSQKREPAPERERER